MTQISKQAQLALTDEDILKLIKSFDNEINYGFINLLGFEYIDDLTLNRNTYYNSIRNQVLYIKELWNEILDDGTPDEDAGTHYEVSLVDVVGQLYNYYD